MKAIDWSLYLITDRSILAGRNLIETVRKALTGGVTILQYREKSAPTRVMIEEASVLRELCRSFDVPFIINDRLDVAIAVDADGVHLGQDDMPPHIARRILGANKIIGLTVHNEKELSDAHRLDINYVSFAPVFPTSTKPDHQSPLGIEGVRRLASLSRLPSVAIGGIKEHHLEALAKTGINGICVVSAILGSENPQEAAKRFISLWKSKET